jgi:hypothetical protein
MRGLAASLTIALLLGCSSTDQTTAPPSAKSSRVLVGIVWWPASTGINALASDVETCLARRIVEGVPEISIVDPRGVRDALYPLLEPALQPKSEAEFAELLTRDDVRARLAHHGLRYLVAFTSGTELEAGQPHGSMLCGNSTPSGCWGVAWLGETTTLDAVLWSLGDGVRAVHGHAKAEGTNAQLGLGFPIPISAHTMSEGCHHLGTEIAREIRRQEEAGEH